MPNTWPPSLAVPLWFSSRTIVLQASNFRFGWFFFLCRRRCLPFKGHLFSNASLAASKFEWHNKCPHFAALSWAVAFFLSHRPILACRGRFLWDGVNLAPLKVTFTIKTLTKVTKLMGKIVLVKGLLLNKIYRNCPTFFYQGTGVTCVIFGYLTLTSCLQLTKTAIFVLKDHFNFHYWLQVSHTVTLIGTPRAFF